jgi:hypothetical protein
VVVAAVAATAAMVVVVATDLVVVVGTVVVPVVGLTVEVPVVGAAEAVAVVAVPTLSPVAPSSELVVILSQLCQHYQAVERVLSQLTTFKPSGSSAGNTGTPES